MISGDSPWIIVIYYTVINEIEAPAATNLIFLGNGVYSFFYYFINIDQILGLALVIYLVVGIISWIKTKTFNFEVLGTLILYFIFQGLILVFPEEVGSTGFFRYFVIIVPFFIIIILDGVIALQKYIKLFFKRLLQHRPGKQQLIENVSLCILLIPVFINVAYILPSNITTTTDPNLALQASAADFLSAHYNLKTTSIYCPLFPNPYIMEWLYAPNLYVQSLLSNSDGE